MTTMFSTGLRIAARALTLGLALGGALIALARGAEPRSADARPGAGGLTAEDFDKLRAVIKPRPGGFDDLAWMTDLWEARKKAAAEGKPLLVWVGDGHPLGWT